ncbi:MAG: NusG domain II-containing protein [Caldicoprobacteraceae bacterium]|mgnify:CR=1 FL=1|jgi:hypothetical protein
MKISLKIGDVFVYVFAVVLVIAGITGMYLMGLKDDRHNVVIEVDRETKYSVEIYEGMEPVELYVDAGDGRYNKVVVMNGEVKIEEANCPDRLCVKSGAIRFSGQTIVCLPHRVVVRLTGPGDSQSDVDDIAH